MQNLTELKLLFAFGPADEIRLQSLRQHVMPRAAEVVARFQQDLQQDVHQDALNLAAVAELFAHSATVSAWGATLVRFIDEFLRGAFDEEHVAHLRDLGLAFGATRFPSVYLAAAVSRLVRQLETIAVEVFPDEAHPACHSLRRAADIELAILTAAVSSVRDQAKPDRLRDLIVSHQRATVILLDKQRRVATSTRPSPWLFTSTEIVGKRLDEALVPAVAQASELEEYVARAVSTGVEVVAPRVQLSIEGRTRTFRIAVVPLKDPNADALIELEDLTETLAADERVKHAQHLAKLGLMAASVAHEIRNPLAGISGAVQFIAASLNEGDERRDALQEVQLQIARLGTLVGDLLLFSRPITADPGAVDLFAVAESVVAQSPPGEGQLAEVHGTGSALADEGLLSHVLLNLVQNAWQAGAKNVHVDVAAGHAVVADDGPGVAEADRAKIFEPFFTTKVRGTGLGLQVARMMVEAMQGTLELTTTPLGGAAFELRLPAA